MKNEKEKQAAEKTPADIIDSNLDKDNWVDVMKDDMEDYMEEQGIYIRQ